MTKYLLDTNIVSEIRKPRPHGAVVAWLKGLQDEQLLVSCVTIAELQVGIERLRKHDAKRASEIDAWLDLVVNTYQILPIDAACSREWARLTAGLSNTLYEDAMIAATARVQDLTIATRNEADFAGFGARVLNPFKPG